MNHKTLGGNYVQPTKKEKLTLLGLSGVVSVFMLGLSLIAHA